MNCAQTELKIIEIYNVLKENINVLILRMGYLPKLFPFVYFNYIRI